ncbi:DUF7511 domain-containing protein [Halorussus lipolyticus]|uniref:DUF7511 domain-containing protein n=1 Tax=Halorussus lipolyticus TaxID=3034024 RepID=UPI0023E7D49B|nr:hypothetical protein [Halorussus sp. DT80]
MTNTTPANDDDTVPQTDDPLADPAPADRPSPLTAVVVERDDDADECTLYPADADDEDLVTEWITAEEDSYVALDSMR